MKAPERPSLLEQYQVASSTSDLGLPHGDGAGAQGILAAAAWTEVHLGSALWRLAAAWEIAKPRKKVARTAAMLRAAGMPRDQAKSLHKRELVSFAVAHHREKEALKRRIPEYAAVLEALMVHASLEGIEDPGPKALAVLDRWLDDPKRVPADIDQARLWSHLRDCLSRARAALQQGVRGHTKHEIVDGD